MSKPGKFKLNLFQIGECFGFLGVNGAGKTTSFRMLTGDEYMTEGQSILYGQDLGSKRRKYLRQIGYCPQFDSIIDVLTGREILNLFAHIRGVPLRRMKEEVDKWIEFVGKLSFAAVSHFVDVLQCSRLLI